MLYGRETLPNSKTSTDKWSSVRPQHAERALLQETCPLTWLTAQACASLLRDALCRHQECLPGGHAADRTPDKIQRLLNQVAWDTFAVVRVGHRFAVADRTNDLQL
jgi:hypothetical protein